MFLSKLLLNPRSPQTRRDLADAYDMHSTLCRAFVDSSEKCPPGAFLWRLEVSRTPVEFPILLVQSLTIPDWSRIQNTSWLAIDPLPPINLGDRLLESQIREGSSFRFRLRANPTVCRGGKRIGLLTASEQEVWLSNKGEQHGFRLPATRGNKDQATSRYDVGISQEQLHRCHQRSGNTISVYSVLFDGVLTVEDVEKFQSAIRSGVGRGKAFGNGLLSVVPVA